MKAKLLFLVFTLASWGCRPPEPGHVHAIAFSSNKERVASAISNRGVDIWVIETGKKVASFDFPSCCTVTFSCDDEQVIVGGKTIRSCDPKSGDQRSILNSEIAGYCMDLSPDRKWLVAAGDNVAILYELDTGMAKSFDGQTKTILDVALSKSGQLAIGGDDGSARVWETKEGRQLGVYRLEKDVVSAVRFSRDGKYLFAANQGVIRKFDLGTGRETMRPRLSDGYGYIRSFVISPDDKTLYVPSGRVVALYNVETGKLIRSIAPGHETPIWSITISTDGKWIATGGFSPSGEVRIWEAETGMVIKILK